MHCINNNILLKKDNQLQYTIIHYNTATIEFTGIKKLSDDTNCLVMSRIAGINTWYRYFGIKRGIDT